MDHFWMTTWFVPVIGRDTPDSNAAKFAVSVELPIVSDEDGWLARLPRLYLVNRSESHQQRNAQAGAHLGRMDQKITGIKDWSSSKLLYDLIRCIVLQTLKLYYLAA
ncbi:unnamed protein product [Macrosiphum euphorbiae]|uniref:Uncharacterized protein n=1 Tax=Macrosiphum euphorbiae TaxID=13131 RepID=A0AAV0XQ38_9HEMI|nr:unnamed protein product [Macrosiphum euphorbiae]